MNLRSVAIISNTPRRWIVSTKIAVLPRVLQMAFSLIFGSVPFAFAQIDQDSTNGIQFAGGGGPEGVSASQCGTVGDFTNQHLTLSLFPAPEGYPGLSYSIPPSPESGGAAFTEPSLTSRAQLAEPALTASPQGWRIFRAGVLNYTANNQRWRFVLGYAPDLGTLRDNLSEIRSFNLAWQYSLGKRKPPSWAGIKTGSEHIRRPAPR